MSHNHERSCFDLTSVHQLLERKDRRSSWSKKLGHWKKSNKFLQSSGPFPNYVQKIKSVLPKMSSLPRPISYRLIFQQSIISFNEQTHAVITRWAKMKYVHRSKKRKFQNFDVPEMAYLVWFGITEDILTYFFTSRMKIYAFSSNNIIISSRESVVDF